MARQLGSRLPTDRAGRWRSAQAIVATDPYADSRSPAARSALVTFPRAAPKAKLALPIELDGARVLCLRGREVYSDYLRTPKGPRFMTLIEKALGKEITTRTWDTVVKLARPALASPTCIGRTTGRPSRSRTCSSSPWGRGSQPG